MTVTISVVMPELPPLPVVVSAVKHVREVRGLSLRVAAGEMGLNLNTLWRLESGDVNCRYETVLKALQWVAAQGVA